MEVIFFYLCDEKEIIDMEFPKDTILKDALTQFSEKIDSSLEELMFLTDKELKEESILNKSLSDLKFKHTYIHVFRIVNGGGDSIEFCDVSNGKKELINSNIIYGTPDKGINIYGFCQEKNCIACNRGVVVHIKTNYFDLLYEKNNLKCPICKNIIIPNTVGFLQCEYKIKGKKLIRGNFEEFDFIEIADKSGKINYYQPKNNKKRKTQMAELKFEVIKYL